MAWSSPETKMDTGQLYVTTDGEHFTPVTEVSMNGVKFVPVESPSQRAESERLLKLREIPLTIDIKLDVDWLPMQLDIYNYCVNDVTTATEMLELQKRIDAIQAEIERVEREERKKKISHLAYIFALLGTNPDLSIEKRKWCCDELAEMFLSGDLDDIIYTILPRRNGKMIFQRMLELILEEHGCKVYRARALSGYPTIVVKPDGTAKQKIYKRSIFTEADLEDCLKGDLDDFVESLGSYKCSRFWQNVSGPINYGCRLGIDIFPEELKPSKTAEEIDPKAVYISSTGTIKENFAYEYLGKYSERSNNPRLKHSHDMIDATILAFKHYSEINHNAVCKIKTNNEKEKEKMDAKKCDRCGKLYIENNEPIMAYLSGRVTDNEKDTFTPEKVREINTYRVEMYLNGGHRMDMCPDCKKKLKEFFESETVETKEAET